MEIQKMSLITSSWMAVLVPLHRSQSLRIPHYLLMPPSCHHPHFPRRNRSSPHPFARFSWLLLWQSFLAQQL